MISKSQVKYIQSLGQKKHRDEEGVFIAEGPKLVKELLEAEKVEVKEIFGTKDWIDKNKKLLTNTTAIEIDEKELERISQLTTPHEVVAIIQKLDWNKLIVTKGKITVVLDNIQDPGNLGT